MTIATGAKDGARASASFALVAALGLAVIAAAIVHAPALRSFFVADDLRLLERAAGLAPGPVSPWRWLSQVGAFRALHALFGVSPGPWFAVTLGLHLANVALVVLLARRLGAGAVAAGLAGVGFGACPLFASVVGRAATLNDLGALACMLGAACLAASALRGRAILAAALFVTGAFWKESIVLVPAALAFWPRRAPAPRPRLREVVVLLAAAAILATAYLVARAAGLAMTGAAYETGWGPHVFHNAMTYLTWETDWVRAIPDRVTSFDARAWPHGLAVVTALALGFMFGGRGIVGFGAAWWLAAILPVLALRNSTYGAYAYVAHAGLAIALGGAVEGVLARGRGASWGRVATATAVVLASLATVAGARLVRERGSLLLPGVGLPADTWVRQSTIARDAAHSFTKALPPDARRVIVLSPAEGLTTMGARSGREVAGGTRRYDLLEFVLDDGRALRLFAPHVEDAEIAPAWDRRFADHDLFVSAGGGRLDYLGRGREGVRALSEWLTAARLPRTAEQALGEALELWPDDATIRFGYSLARLRLGDRSGAFAELRELMRRSPDDPLAERARDLLRAATRVSASRP